MSGKMEKKHIRIRYFRKRVGLARLIEKVKLWPSRQGFLHGIRSLQTGGGRIVLVTHCGRTIVTADSRNSRAARWLRNKIFAAPCPLCRVPDWKMAKYSATNFRRGFGSSLGGAGGEQGAAGSGGGGPGRSPERTRSGEG